MNYYMHPLKVWMFEKQYVFSDWIKEFNLAHCGQVMPYGDTDLGYIGSGNGLVPDGTKPLPGPMLTDHKWGLVAFI